MFGRIFSGERRIGVFGEDFHVDIAHEVLPEQPRLGVTLIHVVHMPLSRFE